MSLIITRKLNETIVIGEQDEIKIRPIKITKGGVALKVERRGHEDHTAVLCAGLGELVFQVIASDQPHRVTVRVHDIRAGWGAVRLSVSAHIAVPVHRLETLERVRRERDGELAVNEEAFAKATAGMVDAA